MSNPSFPEISTSMFEAAILQVMKNPDMESVVVTLSRELRLQESVVSTILEGPMHDNAKALVLARGSKLNIVAIASFIQIHF